MSHVKLVGKGKKWIFVYITTGPIKQLILNTVVFKN